MRDGKLFHIGWGEAMELKVGTLKELGVCAGDVVKNVSSKKLFDIVLVNEDTDHERIKFCDFGKLYALSRDGENHQSVEESFMPLWCVISLATPSSPKLWKDLTPEEKGALLLAAHEGKIIEFYFRGRGWAKCVDNRPLWSGNDAYRIKPEPKIETVSMAVHHHPAIGWQANPKCATSTHNITFNTIDGKPDCSSVKMEEI